jgi:hypothetical protein
MTKEFNVIIERDEEGYYIASVPYAGQIAGYVDETDPGSD